MKRSKAQNIEMSKDQKVKGLTDRTVKRSKGSHKDVNKSKDQKVHRSNGQIKKCQTIKNIEDQKVKKSKDQTFFESTRNQQNKKCMF